MFKMNKFYIRIVLFLLSVSLYVNNETLATEPAPQKVPPKDTNEATTPYLNKCQPTPEEIYEKNKNLLCTNHQETREAIKLMNEVAKHIEDHATSIEGYTQCKTKHGPGMVLYKKKQNNTNIKKMYYIVRDFYQHNEIINEIWNPNHANPFNPGSVKIFRVYNPNLVMIQHRYEKKFGSSQKYFYALAARVEISKEKTIIAMASANINDGYPSKKEYKNKIIESANLFKTQINSEDDIRKGKLTKVFVNVAGYFIQKYDNRIDIAYVESIDGYDSFKQKSIIDKALNKFF
ncbi:fam-a protein [Plasmodium vinckei brucechwatti]|uniref:Fam-a protein n=1 Tax=Plasmodium vinckei brucechwatti TaxID=119398 RepID=A0A6V7S481_PLAVN|nr:fam-a protein [Plasmodium vinckei brucechwatti]